MPRRMTWGLVTRRFGRSSMFRLLQGRWRSRSPWSPLNCRFTKNPRTYSRVLSFPVSHFWCIYIHFISEIHYFYIVITMYLLLFTWLYYIYYNILQLLFVSAPTCTWDTWDSSVIKTSIRLEDFVSNKIFVIIILLTTFCNTLSSAPNLTITWNTRKPKRLSSTLIFCVEI